MNRMMTPRGLALLVLAALGGAGLRAEDAPKGLTFKPGEKVVLKGRPFFVEKFGDGKLILTAPLPPTQSLGAFLTPVDANASSSQSGAGRTPRRMIDGSGWGESFPGSGVYVHTNNVFADGACMWNGKPHSWLLFDLGKACNVNGMYVWNYNEKGGWNSRSVQRVEVTASSDGKSFSPVGTFTLRKAPGSEDYGGEVVPFAKPVRARYFRWQIKSNYRGGEMSGVAEVRFSDADAKAAPPVAPDWTPKYTRPTHPTPGLGKPLAGAENVVFPPDAGIVDVAKPPYLAKGDGMTDDTAAIQRALDDHPAQGAIIYLPNGVYIVSDTLRWGGKDSQQKQTVLQGQSRAAAVLKLRDNCPGFANPRKPKAVIYTGHAPAQRFGNEIHNLTVDTGTGNVGASAVQFIANNQGGMYDVTIVSGDGFGVIGLDMGYTDEQGPCLIKNVKVVGFDVGIRVATSVASETMEHITVERQNKVGFRNEGQPCTIRGLRSVNAVPALHATAGFTVLVDSVLEGTGAAAKLPAIINDATMMARNVRTTGYAKALVNHAKGGAVGELAGPDVEQFLSKPASSLFGRPGKGLRLPVRETPEVPWDSLEKWTAPQKSGAVADDRRDDSEAIQKAIDSGATTVYLPRGHYRIGKTIVIRGKVRRILGCKATLDIAAPLSNQAQPMFRFADGEQPVVSMEWINTDFSGGPYHFMEHAAKRALVMRRMAINFQAAHAYHSSGTGDVYIEDVVGRWFRFKNQSLWARQFNVEGDGLHVLNEGGSAWILGYKTEGGGTLLATTKGGKTELLGGLSYTVGKSLPEPMFLIDNAAASFSFPEVCYNNRPFALIVRETRDGATKEMPRSDPAWKSHFTLFTSGRP
jgi:hypothetical protein